MTFRLAFVKRLPGPTLFGVGKEFINIFPSYSTTVYKAVKSNKTLRFFALGVYTVECYILGAK